MITEEGILSDLVRIKSVNPPGGELEVAEYLKDLFDREGIESKIIHISPGRGNFLAHLGEGEKKLLYLSHTDVVPGGGGWEFDPFSGRIKGGFVWGRGAIDCKGLVACEAYALLKLKKERLKGRLTFAATCDEEGEGKGIKHLIQNYPDEIGVDLVINEGAEGPLRIGPNTVYLMQAGEKGVLRAYFHAHGLSAHGSIPALGENAITKMARALEELAKYKPEVILSPEVEEMFWELLGTKVTPQNLDCVVDSIEDKKLREYLRAVTRMTVSVNTIQGGVKVNMVPDFCSSEVDIRVMPGQDEEYVKEELEKAVGENIQVEIGSFFPSSLSPFRSPYTELIQRTLREVARDDAVMSPVISSAATDSRFLRRMGIPCYGIDILEPSISNLIHAPNERMDIKSLRVRTDFLIRLAQNYLS